MSVLYTHVAFEPCTALGSSGTSVATCGEPIRGTEALSCVCAARRYAATTADTPAPRCWCSAVGACDVPAAAVAPAPPPSRDVVVEETALTGPAAGACSDAGPGYSAFCNAAS